MHRRLSTLLGPVFVMPRVQRVCAFRDRLRLAPARYSHKPPNTTRALPCWTPLIQLVYHYLPNQVGSLKRYAVGGSRPWLP